jgi:hypothetical protein
MASKRKTARTRTGDRPAPSGIPEDVKARAALARAEQKERDRLAREASDRDERCRATTLAYCQAHDNLLAAECRAADVWPPPLAPDQQAVDDALRALPDTLPAACRALLDAGRLELWKQVDHDGAYLLCRGSLRPMLRESYDWAVSLFDRSCQGELSPALLVETWETEALRNALRWLRIFLCWLSGQGAVLPTRTPDPRVVSDGNGGRGPDRAGRLALAPGGFTLGERLHPLTGRPRQMLHVLLGSSHHTATAARLRQEMDIDEESVTFPEQVIRDTASALRRALKRAASATGLSCPKDPLPSTGRGEELTYSLSLR